MCFTAGRYHSSHPRSARSGRTGAARPSSIDAHSDAHSDAGYPAAAGDSNHTGYASGTANARERNAYCGLFRSLLAVTAGVQRT